MITAIDTNVILDVVIPDQKWGDVSGRALELADDAGSLVICDIVHAELLAHFGSVGLCGEFLADTKIRVERVSPEAAMLAGTIWAAYRRRGGKRTRILPDFLVGAHAQIQASRFLTRDQRFYSAEFRDLAVVRPEL